MSDKIPTAEELLLLQCGKKVDLISWNNTIIFAKNLASFHIEAALKAASEKGLVCLENLDREGRPIGNNMEAKEINIIGKIPSKVYIKKISILNAYPKENIQ